MQDEALRLRGCPREPAQCKARVCYDHLAGALGAALLARIYALGWSRRAKNSRVVQFSELGEYAFRQLLNGKY